MRAEGWGASDRNTGGRGPGDGAPVCRVVGPAAGRFRESSCAGTQRRKRSRPPQRRRPGQPDHLCNDWWFDVFDNNYLWTQASLGAAILRGNIVSRNLSDWEKGYHYSFAQSWQDAEKALKLACDSGLKHLPDLTRGSDCVLLRPESGRV